MTNKVDMRAWVDRVERIEAENAELKSRLETLPNWGPPRPMAEAPRDGTKILVREDGEDQFAVVYWTGKRLPWDSGHSGSWAEIALLGWWPLPEPPR